MVIGLGQQELANGSVGDQLLRAQQLGVEPAVVGNPQQPAVVARRDRHLLGLGQVESHRLFAQHLLARAQGGDRLLGVQRHRRRYIDRVDGGIAERLVQPSERLHAGICLGLARIAGKHRVQTAARLRQDRREHAFAGDVANPDDQPDDHL